jgi:hypothetical protein
LRLLRWRARRATASAAYEIVDATAPDWAFVVPKISRSARLVSTIAISGLAAMLVQALKGY